MSKVCPTYHANNLFEIEPSFFIKIKVKVILLDLDNTLDSYKTKLPTKRTFDYINKLKELGFRLIITSNNLSSKRVKLYADALGIEYYCRMGKPFKGKLLKKLDELNINKDDCIICGDQLLTDVTCGNSAKIKTLLFEKLVKEDAFFTRFNRLIDKPLRARLRKCGKLKDWKEIL